MRNFFQRCDNGYLKLLPTDSKINTPRPQQTEVLEWFEQKLSEGKRKFIICAPTDHLTRAKWEYQGKEPEWTAFYRKHKEYFRSWFIEAIV
ncbi:MAG: hypothetical protein M0R51_10015 [Clostridia bacterium]|jgi:hypothetical protein|nr:hypothetical protein [Clostridia bacterium]